VNQELLHVSVVVVNFNGEETLGPTLKSVFALERVRLIQVMLVDNHSTDGSLALVREDFPEVIIQSMQENRGPNPARNAGLRLSSTDLVLIMDNDIVLEPDYIGRLAEVFRKYPEAGAASGQIRLYGESDIIQYNGVDIHYAGEVTARRSESPEPVKVACVSAGAALFDRRKAQQIGGFDEDFVFGWEDGDMTFRMSLSGYPCYILSGAVAYHMRRSRGMKWIRYQTRNRWWFILKNYDLRTFILSFPAILFFQACAGLFLLARGQFGAFLKGTFEAVAGLPALRRKRQAVQRLKVVSDADLLRGDRLDLPGGLSSSRLGRMFNSILNTLFHVYWILIRSFLRRSPARVNRQDI